MDRGVDIILHKALRQKDGILVIVAFPCHESDQRVLAERKLAVARGRTVRNDLTGFNALTLFDDRLLVIAVALIASRELDQMIVLPRAVVIRHPDIRRAHECDGTCTLRKDAESGVDSRLLLHTCTDCRCFRCEKRDSLALHVGAHEGAVRVVVLQERDERRSDGEDHLRRDVHIVEHRAVVGLRRFAVTAGDVLSFEMTFLVERLVRLRNVVIIFLIRRHIVDVVRYARIERI